MSTTGTRPQHTCLSFSTLCWTFAQILYREEPAADLTCEDITGRCPLRAAGVKELGRRGREGMRAATRWYLWAAHSRAAQSWEKVSRRACNVIPWNSPSGRQRELLVCSCLSTESCWSHWPQKAWTPLHSEPCYTRSWYNTPEQKQQKGMASEARNGRRCHRLCGSVR